MVVIVEMVGRKVISGFRGVIDYYYCRGLACARSWPRKPSMERTPAVKAGWAPWAYAASHWNELSQEVRDAYTWTAQGSSLTGRDLFTKSFISDYFREGQWD